MRTTCAIWKSTKKSTKKSTMSKSAKRSEATGMSDGEGNNQQEGTMSKNENAYTGIQ